MTTACTDQCAKLFLEHHDRLHRFALDLVRSNSNAEDLVQETFLRVHDYMQNGNVIRAPLSFLFKSIRNLANDRYRRNRQKTVRLIDDSIDIDYVVPDNAAASLEQQIISERELEGLCVAVNRLPERMRKVFVLRKIYGYSCREIANHMGTSVETIKKQAVQGLKKINEQRV